MPHNFLLIQLLQIRNDFFEQLKCLLVDTHHIYFWYDSKNKKKSTDIMLHLFEKKKTENILVLIIIVGVK